MRVMQKKVEHSLASQKARIVCVCVWRRQPASRHVTAKRLQRRRPCVVSATHRFKRIVTNGLNEQGMCGGALFDRLVIVLEKKKGHQQRRVLSSGI